jgi:transcriptional regulator with XRE-family HTH domain
MGRSEESHELGLWIRQRRLERGLKQHVLAERAGLSRRWLIDVENGRLQPKFADLLRLVEVLGVDLGEAPGVRRPRAGPAAGKLPGEEGTEAKRREFLGWIAAAAGSAALVDVERLASSTADATWLRDAEIVSEGLAGQYSAVEPASLLPAVVGHLAALESMLPASAELTAKTALLAGNLITRTRTRTGHAFRCYALAESLGSPTVIAKSINGRAALYGRAGDLSHALSLQDEALAGLGRAAPALRAGLLARRAELWAQAGNDSAAMRDLDQAERDLGRPYEWWYFGMRTSVELAAYRGAVLAGLGRHREAADALTWVLERLDPAKVAWRATVMADRDAALAQL